MQHGHGQERRAASRQAEIGVEWHSIEGHRVGIEVSPDGARFLVMRSAAARLQRSTLSPLATGGIERNAYPFGEPYLTLDEPRGDLSLALTAGILEAYRRIVRRNEAPR